MEITKLVTNTYPYCKGNQNNSLTKTTHVIMYYCCGNVILCGIYVNTRCVQKISGVFVFLENI